MSDSVQRAVSKRWAKSNTKDIYDDWDDDNSIRDEEEEEEEIVKNVNKPEQQQQKCESRPHETIVNEVTNHASGSSQISLAEPGIILSAPQKLKPLPVKQELSPGDGPRQVTSQQKQLEATATESVVPMSQPTHHTSASRIVSGASAQTPVSEASGLYANASVDSIESYRKRSEQEHLERQGNLDLMEGLMKKISNQLSVDEQNDDENDSDNQSWGDDSDKDSVTNQDNSFQNSIQNSAQNSYPGQEPSRLESKKNNDSSGLTARAGLDKSQIRPISLNNDPLLRASDTSKLDQNFKDLFNDFENLSFSTDVPKTGADDSQSSTPQKVPKTSQTLLPDGFAVDVEPLSPGRPKEKALDKFESNKVNGEEAADSEDDQIPNGSISSDSDDESQAFRASAGVWGHVDDSKSKTTPSLDEKREAGFAAPPSRGSFNEDDSVLDSIVDSEKFNMPQEDAGISENISFASTEDAEPSYGDLDADPHRFKDVSDSEDNQGDQEFIASQGVWSTLPSESANKHDTSSSAAGAITGAANLASIAIKPSAPQSSNQEPKRELERKDTFPSITDESFKDERVFGDNFPSKSADDDSFDTDDQSEFRTSIFRNEFLNKTQQQQHHEAFNPSAISSSALAAASRYQNQSQDTNQNQSQDTNQIPNQDPKPQRKEAISAKDILGDGNDSFSSRDSADINRKESNDISFAKEYLGLADDDEQDVSSGASDDDGDAFKASGGLWAPQGSKGSPRALPHPESGNVAKVVSNISTSKSDYARDRDVGDSNAGDISIDSDLSADGSGQEQNRPATSKQPVTASLDVVAGMGKQQQEEKRQQEEKPQLPKLETLGSKSTTEDWSPDNLQTPLTKLTATFGNHEDDDKIRTSIGSAPTTPVTAKRVVSAGGSTPRAIDGRSPAVPPKDPSMFSPRNHIPVKHNMQQIFNNTPEQAHEILRNVRRDEYLYDTGLHTWLAASLKSTSNEPKVSVMQIGRHTKAAYDVAAQKTQTSGHGASTTARRMSLNSKINISSHRFLKGTKNVNKNVKGKLEEGFAKGLFKRKK